MDSPAHSPHCLNSDRDHGASPTYLAFCRKREETRSMAMHYHAVFEPPWTAPSADGKSFHLEEPSAFGRDSGSTLLLRRWEVSWWPAEKKTAHIVYDHPRVEETPEG
ncbi:hypothetical protein JOB18_037467 [Solea senegalensis]|uniref:Uncharacterized protein n=1 Tax=Solea senegalensis TaxID=28829 RepID=A0AAV6QWL1_SOLSE|nr:hypothetical protein JOB18_037467 [Solea senegalensis]